MKSEKYAMIIGLLMGLIIGISTTYVYMNNQRDKTETENEQEKISITEKLNLEIKKLSLKNRTYEYVDLIEKTISNYNLEQTEEKDKILTSMFALNEENEFYEIDIETNEPKENGRKLKIEFLENPPLTHTVIILNEKSVIEEAIFLVEDNFQIKYNLIGTTVTKLEDK